MEEDRATSAVTPVRLVSRCNYCLYQDIRRVADNAGGTVEVRPTPTDYAPDGVDVFIRYPNDAEPVWAAWLMKLPDRCVC